MSSLSRALLATVLAVAAFLGAARTAAATEKPFTVLPAVFTAGAAAPAPRSASAPFTMGAVGTPKPRAVEAPPFDFPAPDAAAACSGCRLLPRYTLPPFILEGAS
jgi:hypothetical protein